MTIWQDGSLSLVSNENPTNRLLLLDCFLGLLLPILNHLAFLLPRSTTPWSSWSSSRLRLEHTVVDISIWPLVRFLAVREIASWDVFASLIRMSNPDKRALPSSSLFWSSSSPLISFLAASSLTVSWPSWRCSWMPPRLGVTPFISTPALPRTPSDRSFSADSLKDLCQFLSSFAFLMSFMQPDIRVHILESLTSFSPISLERETSFSSASVSTALKKVVSGAVARLVCTKDRVRFISFLCCPSSPWIRLWSAWSFATISLIAVTWAPSLPKSNESVQMSTSILNFENFSLQQRSRPNVNVSNNYSPRLLVYCCVNYFY